MDEVDLPNCVSSGQPGMDEQNAAYDSGLDEDLYISNKDRALRTLLSDQLSSITALLVSTNDRVLQLMSRQLDRSRHVQANMQLARRNTTDRKEDKATPPPAPCLSMCADGAPLPSAPPPHWLQTSGEDDAMLKPSQFENSGVRDTAAIGRNQRQFLKAGGNKVLVWKAAVAIPPPAVVSADTECFEVSNHTSGRPITKKIKAQPQHQQKNTDVRRKGDLARISTSRLLDSGTSISAVKPKPPLPPLPNALSSAEEEANEGRRLDGLLGVYTNGGDTIVDRVHGSVVFQSKALTNGNHTSNGSIKKTATFADDYTEIDGRISDEEHYAFPTHPNNIKPVDACSIVRPDLDVGPRFEGEISTQRSRKTIDDPKSRPVAKKEEEMGQRPPRKTAREVFLDQDVLKNKVREAIAKPEYNVADLYKKDGFWVSIANHQWFENLSLTVITLNAFWMMFDTDFNHEILLRNADPIFQVAEHSACIYFTVELLVRFMAFEVKWSVIKDNWFMFDSLLVAMMVTETWVMSIIIEITSLKGDGKLKNAGILRLLRLVRIARMARLVRLLRAMPELMILIKGIAMASRSVFFTLWLLLIIIYVFAIAFVQLLGDGEPPKQEYFSTVPDAMNSLLLHGCFGEDLPAVVNAVGKTHIALGALLMIFVLLASLTVMNMLIGVLVEVVQVVASIEKETMQVQFVKSKLRECLESLDDNSDALISRTEFESMLEKPSAARALQDVGVDVVGLIDFTDFIFEKEDDLSFFEFMDTVLKLRGTNQATVKDIVDMRKSVIAELKDMTRSLSSLLGQKIVLD
eukprot:TRINITY_DN20425_c0_g1_i1.p1 TRINITY_DN20425_c0_g1~~TRINITY_DN20425_c0_g1_i1.p1  ORF type:complete len:824 (+),score=148.36 TRINITY_DN20425_c0_g1_i1:66-2474(+)